MHVGETSRTSEQNCYDLFTSMEKYKDSYDAKDGSIVPRDFKLTHPFLKKCHKIEKESKLRENAGS